jgi:hypothetical protein
LGALSPLPGPGEDVVVFALNFLPSRHGAGARGLDLDEGIFHFLNHESHQLFRILGTVQHGVDIGIDDVANA